MEEEDDTDEINGYQVSLGIDFTLRLRQVIDFLCGSDPDAAYYQFRSIRLHETAFLCIPNCVMGKLFNENNVLGCNM